MLARTLDACDATSSTSIFEAMYVLHHSTVSLPYLPYQNYQRRCSKMSLRSNVDTARYSAAANLQAVIIWKQRKHLAQLRTGAAFLKPEMIQSHTGKSLVLCC